MNLVSYEGEGEDGMLPLKGSPRPVPAKIERIQRKGFFRLLGEFLHLCKRRSVEDLARLEEAGIGYAEAKTSELSAAAKLKVSMATVQYAKADKEHADAQANKLLAEATLLEKSANAETARLQATQIDRERRREAVEQVKDLFSKIRQEGGMVAFNSRKLVAQIRFLYPEFRNDEDLRDFVELLVEECAIPPASNASTQPALPSVDLEEKRT